MENLDALSNLDDLYISHNGIQKIQGLDNNTELTTLDLAGNRISALDNLKALEKIEEFWFNDNQVYFRCNTVPIGYRNLG